MAFISSVGLFQPPNQVEQEDTVEFAKELFEHSFKDIDRLLQVFQNGEIKNRSFAASLDWLKEEHSFQEKNDLFVESAIAYSKDAIKNCLQSHLLKTPVQYEEIDAIFFITSTGVATPSIDARIINELPFSTHTKRIPIWGLGCAGGAAGLSRAYEYCKAFPHANVLVISVELCSLTFQRSDQSKSNLVGTSIFADGVAAVLVSGKESDVIKRTVSATLPKIIGTRSSLMKNSLDVMGWDIKDDGFFVVFSRSIPSIIKEWLKPQVEDFIEQHQLKLSDIRHFIAHPGGKKVIEAYQKALEMFEDYLANSKKVLTQHGNMSSATVFFVLYEFLNESIQPGEYGLTAALGPGFSAEMLLLKWELRDQHDISTISCNYHHTTSH